MTNTSDSKYDDSYLNKISDKKIKGASKYKYNLYTFIIITLLQIFVNYDIGLVPVSLNWIQEPYNFSSTELGIMGSFVNFAYVVMSPLMPYMFLKFSTQPLITVGLICNILSLGIYALSVSKYMFFVSKFCIGASQALFTTYYPIWVDTFAPKFHRNLWMSIIQGGIVIGMTLGYIITSLYSYAGDKGWRYSMLTQILFGLVLTILFYFIPKEFVNFDPSRDEHLDFDLCTCEKSNPNTTEMDSTNKSVCLSSTCDDLSQSNDSVLKRYRSVDFISKVSSLGISNHISKTYSSFDSSTNKPEYSKCSKCFINNVKLYQETMNVKKLSVWSKFKLLIKQRVYILNCFATSYAHYSCNGIYFWMTTIGVSFYNIKMKTAFFIFSFEIFSGILLGITVGSSFIDNIIHNYPENPLLVDLTLIIWSSITFILGVMVIIFKSTIIYVIGVFITFFFESSTVPTLTLQSVAYLPHRLKPAGASFFICQYQIFGFAFGSIIPGLAIDIFKNYTAALCVIYLPGFIGLGSLVSILCIKYNSIKRQQQRHISYF
ncbi:integral membrane protein family I, putative [Theileria annulata]|uniref:Integral membrane protein family I, putative n=1 Tax=Theileria annulata TaxID=5874 RepID=Q4UCA0_THEAN|nr:integral membrane protein family I, putative [Theileria annulata]XP_955027.1 integral membrane protein family I, putative [Theileria annulata]CAI75548.1 integral membrane protein family I, putative [Theileria annulata]CAI75551.1 integral membrane protein family I, putative [Theileria annulata]|eukprot:XP_955024.1 integral membrane protein family I, putative [Theileria annulata]